MPGEIWRSAFQIGKESVYGTPVAATRKMYFRPDSNLNAERDPRPHRFATGTRDNVRAFTLGPEMVSGQVSLPMSYDELLELLCITVQATPTPSTVDTNGRLWTFTPGTTLDSATIRWDDGANVWIADGVYGDTLRIAGSANGENLVTCDLFGQNLAAGSLTGSLADRVPVFSEGWETKLYIDAFAGTPGTTNIAGQLINWDVSFANGLGRKFFADNVNQVGAVTLGELQVEATLTFEASGAQVDTELANWTAGTKRLVRLEFGNNTLVGAVSAKGFVTLDIPGAWSAYPLGGDDENTRVYELKLVGVYDPTNAFGFRARVQTARTAAFA